ncbi:MAG: GNAT family N-acetyltransferase [Actinomycetota bacterium]
MALELVVPDETHLPGYVAALRRRWSPNTMRPEAADEELARVEADPTAFLAALDDREGTQLPPVVLPDGTTRPRIPGLRRWLWDGEFCGSINARWQPGTVELPPHVLGHVGYTVVPWKRRRGYASRALGLLLEELAFLDLPYVELTTTPDNVGSQRVIEVNGGVMIEEFEQGQEHGGGRGLRYRIALAQAPIE